MREVAAAGGGQSVANENGIGRRSDPDRPAWSSADFAPKDLSTHFRSYSWLLAVAWSLCVAGSLLWNVHQQHRHVRAMTRAIARITFENDVVYRRWAARQGGVYVRVSEHTPPNPYLTVPERDLTTTSGLALTLVNPAYMTRQVHEMAEAVGGSRGHITSLRPIRPENAADPWEVAALEAFEQGVAEFCSVKRIGEVEYMRLMRPFVVEKSCLRCHAAQGYREGDIRGGISISVPTQQFRAIEEPMTTNLVMAHVGLWAVGLIGIGMSKRSLGRQILAREKAERDLRTKATELRVHAGALRESEGRYRALIETAPDAIVVHRDGRFLYANNMTLGLTGAGSFEELARCTVLDFFRPEDHEQASERTRMAMAGSRLPMREGTLRRLDGREVPVEFHTAPVELQGALAILTIIRDITERKKAEKSLREFNARLETEVAERTAELEHRTRQLQELALELTQAEDRERRRIAAVLHEDLQQQIAGAKFHLSLLNGRIAHNPQHQAVIANIDEILREAIEKSRNLSYEISPAVLHHNDLAEALRWLVHRMGGLHGLTVDLDAPERMPLEWDALTIFLFRAAQEMLFNVIQHAGVRKATVRVARRGRYVRLSVSDEGRGFDPQGLRGSAGFGLLSIRERTEFLGGRMRIKGRKGGGSTFHVLAPDGQRPRKS